LSGSDWLSESGESEEREESDGVELHSETNFEVVRRVRLWSEDGVDDE